MAAIFERQTKKAPAVISISDEKKALRAAMAETRMAAADESPNAAARAAHLFLEAIKIKAGDVVSLYAPIRSEMDTAPLMAALWAAGVQTALPVTVKPKSPLIFRAYKNGDPLETGVYGARIPTGAAPEISPRIVVTPLLAFTRGGDRLGYGGGFYDRTFSALRDKSPIVAVGYGFAAQEVDAVPIGPLDQRLDWIVTEREAIRVKAR